MTSPESAVTLVMAEDDPDDRLLVRDAFEEAGVTHELQFVGDGEELLDYLHGRGRHANRAASPLPALILLDLNMPRMDGREALARLKGDPALASIPVVIVTTSTAAADIANAYALGANSYVTKPATYSGLVDRVRVLNEYWFRVVTLPPGPRGPIED